MSGFRECAVLVFKRLLGLEPPPSYLDDLERLNAAAAEWHQLPDQQRGGILYFEVPDLTSGAMVTGSLPLAIERGWCGNEATKDFVRYIDERTGQRGTLLMLQVIIFIQQGVQANKVNAAGGEG